MFTRWHCRMGKLKTSINTLQCGFSKQNNDVFKIICCNNITQSENTIFGHMCKYFSRSDPACSKDVLLQFYNCLWILENTPGLSGTLREKSQCQVLQNRKASSCKSASQGCNHWNIYCENQTFQSFDVAGHYLAFTTRCSYSPSKHFQLPQINTKWLYIMLQ